MISLLMFVTILIFLILLSVLVFVHELGHFLVARACGMKVEEFGFGFPPRAFGIRRGNTVYSINWIPLGGFVKIKGENGSHREDPDSFASKKPWQKFLVLVAGVAMNFLLAAILFSVISLQGLPTVIENGVPNFARVTQQHLTVMQVLPDSPAAKAGIESGDVIASIDGLVFEQAADARTYIAEHGTEGVDLVIQKIDKQTAKARVIAEQIDGKSVIGTAFVQTGKVFYPWYLAVPMGFLVTGEYTIEILKAFGGLIKDLVISQEVRVDLSGPVGIAVMTGEIARSGFVNLLSFAAILSINLGVINILPIPALDGGRILFLLIEKLRGRSLNERWENLVHNLGFVFLMALVVLVTMKDVVHLFK